MYQQCLFLQISLDLHLHMLCLSWNIFMYTIQRIRLLHGYMNSGLVGRCSSSKSPQATSGIPQATSAPTDASKKQGGRCASWLCWCRGWQDVTNVLSKVVNKKVISGKCRLVNSISYTHKNFLNIFGEVWGVVSFPIGQSSREFGFLEFARSLSLHFLLPFFHLLLRLVSDRNAYTWNLWMSSVWGASSLGKVASSYIYILPPRTLACQWNFTFLQ